MDPLQIPFGHVVHRKRAAAGLSQEALSEAAGLHRTCVGLLERGLRMPPILVAKRVAEALEMDDGRPAGRGRRGAGRIEVAA